MPRLWRQGQVVRPEGCAGGRRRRARRRNSSDSDAVRVQAIGRRRGHRQQHLVGAAGPPAAEARVGLRAQCRSRQRGLPRRARSDGQRARQGGANKGDVDSALASAARRVRRIILSRIWRMHRWKCPMPSHIGSGDTCETWSPSQNPTQARQTVAQVLGVNETDVTVNVTLLGGGFGRKSKPDYVAEAALLSRMVGAPIKVTWTREDDIQHDFIMRSAPSTSKRGSIKRPRQCMAAPHRLSSDRGDIPAERRLRQRRRTGSGRRRHAL